MAREKVKIGFFHIQSKVRPDVPVFANYHFQSVKILILIGLYINSNVAMTATDLTVNLTVLENEY
ncbi:hypothetical protein HNP38_002488 [Chryseobacterium defluvii]|uniref:Uncharacterized protein n=1 Tax=Chryseobacterium defluvii TaxID=160396 RepID=A0A840KHM3_9FLAO|nr:hypothetical protein [Chryseobacterium defluvii]